MTGELAPVGPELSRRNRRLIAARVGWPVGAVEFCESAEEDFPGWRVNYMGENSIAGFERPAGSYAVTDISWRTTTTVYGETPYALLTALLKQTRTARRHQL